ncbi:MAG: hypothetical protein RBU31_08645 [Syntrophales bacterium]|nr:hypothetical protein [Syntrophales bacterium]
MNETKGHKTTAVREDLFRLACDNLVFGIALLDKGGDLVYLNPAMGRMFHPGIRRWSDLKALMSAPDGNGTPGGDGTGDRAERLDAFIERDDAGAVLEEYVAVPGGKAGRLWVHVRVIRLEPRRFMMVFQDVAGGDNLGDVLAGKWRLEDTLRLFRKTFQDADSLLGVVTGYAEMALADLAGREEPLRHFVQQILRGGSRARDLMKRMTLLAPVENGGEDRAPVTKGKNGEDRA